MKPTFAILLLVAWVVPLAAQESKPSPAATAASQSNRAEQVRQALKAIAGQSSNAPARSQVTPMPGGTNPATPMINVPTRTNRAPVAPPAPALATKAPGSATNVAAVPAKSTNVTTAVAGTPTNVSPAGTAAAKTSPAPFVAVAPVSAATNAAVDGASAITKVTGASPQPATAAPPTTAATNLATAAATASATNVSGAGVPPLPPGIPLPPEIAGLPSPPSPEAALAPPGVAPPGVAKPDANALKGAEAKPPGVRPEPDRAGLAEAIKRAGGVPPGSESAPGAAAGPPRTPPGFPPPPGATPPGPRAAGRPVSTTNVAEKAAAAKTPDKGAQEQGDQVLAAGDIKFQDADLGQVLEVYQELTGRTVLRPATVPQSKITIKTQTELTRKEAVQALDSILSLNGITMVPQGEKFVKALSTGEAPAAGMIFYNADPEDLPEAGQYVCYVAKLKYTDPTEQGVIQALQAFASKAPNSIMAIKSTQTLVLRDYAENIKRMLEVLREIDVFIPAEFKPVVIPIKYALAADIAQVLSSLTAGGGGVTSVGQRPQSSRFGLGASGGASGGAGGYGAGQTGLPGYTAPGMGYQQGAMGQMGSTLGTGSSMGQRSTGTGSFSQRLQQIVNRAASATGEIVVLGQTKIIADERTNSLLVFASDEDIETIKDIVAKLDVVLAQVLIEAVVLEVSLTDTFSFGVSALQKPASSGQWAGVGGYKNEIVEMNPWSWIGQDPDSGTSSNSALLPNLSDGLSYFARYRNDLDIAIRAIAGMGKVNVLSRPRVQTSHAVPCRIFVGETRPYVTGYGYGYGYGGSQSMVAQLRIGIELNVLPLINPDGLVVMDIDQRVDNAGENVKIDGNDVPSTVERSANAKVSVRDGETVILGGFMRSSKRQTDSGVPFLKDIPLLGYLFKSVSTEGQRVELMILIRPKVLPTPEDAAIVANEEKAKLPGVSNAERAFTEDERKAAEKAAKELYKREGL